MKLAISPCPNDTFIFEALINRRVDMRGLTFDVEYHDIEELNRLAATASPHFIKVSAAAIPSLWRDYKVSMVGSALGWGNGPILVKRKGCSSELLRVAVPGLSTTAALLLKRYFKGVREFVPLLFSQIATAVERGEVDGGVLIHEGRFTYDRCETEAVADLGALWEQELHIPLPLGVILMRRDIDEQVQADFQQVVRDSLLWARSHPEQSRDFIASLAQEISSDVIESHINLFVNDYSLELGASGVAAIESLTGIKID